MGDSVYRLYRKELHEKTQKNSLEDIVLTLGIYADI